MKSNKKFRKCSWSSLFFERFTSKLYAIFSHFTNVLCAWAMKATRNVSLYNIHLFTISLPHKRWSLKCGKCHFFPFKLQIALDGTVCVEELRDQFYFFILLFWLLLRLLLYWDSSISPHSSFSTHRKSLQFHFNYFQIYRVSSSCCIDVEKKI
jgi:hypothetical protein